ncbi:hypothetical protein Dsin_016510 [Dipteronia sinensis]|uniref:Uncharacterized protein n=1 Tax=Dipteronia sinensis TaxID=43782 RepID=A0AAE0E5P6_9ROSI|nr:hypothetical protein Dsin_016510 [Dipteronia sinensis]
MRFMKEIIENPDILSEKFNGKERYTQEEIDEVRLEWIEHIKPFVKSVNERWIQFVSMRMFK